MISSQLAHRLALYIVNVHDVVDDVNVHDVLDEEGRETFESREM